MTTVEGTINGHPFQATLEPDGQKGHWLKVQAETRARRIRNACDMLAGGKRRVCRFDRSGFYSKGFAAPKAAD